MSVSRLSQIGVGQRAYSQPTDVTTTSENWGWTAYPVTVDHPKDSISRLGQFGVSLRRYESPSQAIVVQMDKDDWGWTSYPMEIPEQNVYMDADAWGWTPHDVTVCSQSDKGYSGSFNANVWPSCTFNDFVFGPRTHLNIDFSEQNWGWLSYPVDVNFSDPVDITLTKQDWGWTELPIAVSYSYDIQMQITAWGWQTFPIAVELPYEIELTSTDWGYSPIPIAVSYGTDVNIAIGSWGWTPYPVTVDAPSIDIDMRKDDWGWESFPISVRQASLLPDDYEAIAEAVYQKFVAEGVINQILEVWQRGGCDPSYPQTYAPDSITCGGMNIKVETKAGKTTQTRQ